MEKSVLSKLLIRNAVCISMKRDQLYENSRFASECVAWSRAILEEIFTSKFWNKKDLNSKTCYLNYMLSAVLSVVQKCEELANIYR